MANLDPAAVIVGAGMGAVWDTARDLTLSNVGKKVDLITFQPSGGFDPFVRPDIGSSNYETTLDRGALNLNIAASATMTYEGGWIQFLAQLMGTVTASPAETNAGQGDYIHVMDLASTVNGKYVTCAQLTEDDYVYEIPSVKFISASMSGVVNKPPTINFTSIGSRVIATPGTPTNTAAEVTALTALTYNPMKFGGTNHYLRINAQAGGSLSSTNNITIKEWALSVSRPITGDYVLNGANTPYTTEPLQDGGPTVLEFSFKLSDATDTLIDGLTEWINGTEKKAELFIDGAIIGAGANRSIKIQLPRLIPVTELPDGYGASGNTGRRSVTLKYKAVLPTAAPTGMTGVTTPLRITMVTTRVQSYFN